MSFQLSSDQKELADSIRTFLSEKVPSEYLRKRMTAPDSSDPQLWKELLELGLFDLFAEAGQPESPGFSDLAMIAFEAGRALLPEAIVDGILAGVYLFNAVLKDRLNESIGGSKLGEIAARLKSGAERICIAPFVDESLSQVVLKGSSASGELRLVPGLDIARYCIAPFKSGLALLDLGAAGARRVKPESESSLDGTVKIFRARLEACPALDPGIDRERFRAQLDTLRACEMAGLCGRVVEVTCEYLKTRKQFGVPIGGFQAVQHNLADMYLQTEALASLTRFAGWALQHSPEQALLAANSAISFACDAGPEVVEVAIQMHGGIGFTWEYDMHLFLRRARSIAAVCARKSADYDRIIELAAASGA